MGKTQTTTPALRKIFREFKKFPDGQCQEARALQDRVMNHPDLMIPAIMDFILNGQNLYSGETSEGWWFMCDRLWHDFYDKEESRKRLSVEQMMLLFDWAKSRNMEGEWGNFLLEAFAKLPFSKQIALADSCLNTEAKSRTAAQEGLLVDCWEYFNVPKESDAWQICDYIQRSEDRFNMYDLETRAFLRAIQAVL